MIGVSIENVLEETECLDSPLCGQEHWRDTGERKPLLFIGRIDVSLPQFLLSFVQRRLART